MKTRTFISVIILIMVVLIITGSCATDKMAYISKEYEIYGTWVNPDFKDIGQPHGKIVFHPHGIIEVFGADTSTRAQFSTWYVVTNKWIDSKGNIWYTIIHKPSAQLKYLLVKICNSGKTLEYALSNDYPKEINPSDVHSVYRILYRQ